MSETMSGAPMLEVSGLTKRFGGLVAVKNLSFSIRPGEILGLIGPNGAGKSTAMKSVMGVERPTAGSVKLDAWASGSCFSIRGRWRARPCWRTSRSRCCRTS